jgi:ubiquinone/menaquinone biosynthesis C-methylase UbiE
MSQSDVPAVAAFYDNTAAMDIAFGRSLHLGIWPDGDDGSSLTDAQDRLTDLVVAQSGARAGALLLDVGCGVGGPARRLARAANVSVTGITISPQQVEEASARAAQEGLNSRVRFQLADAADLPFPDDEFDAAIAIESIVHMPDKLQALRELFRVLRPGAILTIADATQSASDALTTDVESTADMESATALLKTLLVSACTPDEYRRLASAAGFEVTHTIDLSRHIRPSWPRLLQRLQEEYAELAAVIGEQTVAAMKEIVRLYDAANSVGTVGYILLTVQKPA